MDTPTISPRCPACLDSGYVCECHTTRPWGDLCCDGPERGDQPCRELLCKHGACHCGGAGLQCPACRSAAPQVPAPDRRQA